MDDKKLICLVSSYPMLYNPSCPHYKDRTIRNQIWYTIGMDMNTNWKSCRARWFYIKDTFRRSHNKNTTELISKGNTRKPYRYAKELSFLKELFNESDSKEGIADEIKNRDLPGGDEENDNTENNEAGQNVVQVDSPTNEHSPCHILSTPTQTDSTQSKIQKMSIKKKNPPKSAPPTVEESMASPSNQSLHPVDAFLLGMAPPLKKLGPRDWNKVKIKIFKAVNKYEKKALKG